MLLIKFGRLGLLGYYETQNIEYRNSQEVATDLTENIILLKLLFYKTKTFKSIPKKLKNQRTS